jgi:hypothetical protein
MCGRYFLIDSGSAVSVISTSFVNQFKPGLLKLYDANVTEIDTYGEQNLELCLSLRRLFKGNFVIANVRSPKISADFLSHYGLLIDLKNHRRIDTLTSLKTDGEVYHASEFGISTLNKTLQYGDLSQFMDVITSLPSNGKCGTSVLNHIVTTGPTVAERSSRLTGEELISAKAEFYCMLHQGICRRSSSPRASSLHLVSKKTAGWKACGDHRKLNVQMVSYRPHS